MLAEINQRRAQAQVCSTSTHMPAVGPLSWDAKLTAAATRHSLDMAAHNNMSHVGSDGSTVVERVNDAGYSWQGIGENVAANYHDIADVVDGWMGSQTGHCETIMSVQYTNIGVACADQGGTTVKYWTLVVGH